MSVLSTNNLTSQVYNLSSEITEIVVVSREALMVSSFLNMAGFISGTICNTLVIMTIAMTKKLLNTSINRAVLNLCLADLLVILIDVPLTTTILIGNYMNYMVSMIKPTTKYVMYLRNNFDFILASYLFELSYFFFISSHGQKIFVMPNHFVTHLQTRYRC